MRYVPIEELGWLEEQQIWLATLRGAQGFERPVLLLRATSPRGREALTHAAAAARTLHPSVLAVHELLAVDESLVLVLDAPVGLSVMALADLVHDAGGSIPWPIAVRVAVDLSRGVLVFRDVPRPSRRRSLMGSSFVTEHGVSQLTMIPSGDEGHDLTSIARWLKGVAGPDAPASVGDVLSRALADPSQRRLTLSAFADSLEAAARAEDASHAAVARFLAAEAGAELTRMRAALRSGPRAASGPCPEVASPAEALGRLIRPTPAEDTTTTRLEDPTILDASPRGAQ